MLQSRGAAKKPPHRWVTRRRRRGREEPSQRLLEPAVDRTLHLVGFADRAAEPVCETAPTEGDPAVRGPLGVDELVALIGNRRASCPADLRPRLVGSGSVASM